MRAMGFFPTPCTLAVKHGGGSIVHSVTFVSVMPLMDIMMQREMFKKTQQQQKTSIAAFPELCLELVLICLHNEAFSSLVCSRALAEESGSWSNYIQTL